MPTPVNNRTTSIVDSLLESEDYADVQRYLNLVPSKPQLKRYTREQIKHFLATRDEGELLRREMETPPSEPHQIVGEAVDPLDPEPSMGEVDRHLPTKEVRLRGNSMLFAPNIIRMAQNEWKIGRKKQKAWALELIKSWQGLPDQLYLDILNGKCDITEDGDDAVIVIRQY